MMCAKDSSTSQRSGWRAGWVHFGIAAVLLAATTIGWGWTMRALKLVTQKKAVPWPDSVIVNPETFRWENLPERIGDRFILAEDGELSDGSKDGLDDGQIILEDDIKDILGLGTNWDKQRVSRRRSNWYVTRIYRDESRPKGHPLRYWRLEVCYYTGRLDTVPHVPERCLKAAGVIIRDSKNVIFRVPTARKPWDKPLAFRRIDAERMDRYGSTHQLAVYYTFSINGEPEDSWEQVRLTLSYPWIRHCYFAKIQFGPESPVAATKELDVAAEDFLNYFLPIILQALPMPAEVKAIESTDMEAD